MKCRIQFLRPIPAQIEQFGRVMRQNLTTGEILFRKAYLGSIVDRIEVDDREVRILGHKDVLEQCILATGSPHGRFADLYAVGWPERLSPGPSGSWSRRACANSAWILRCPHNRFSPATSRTPAPIGLPTATLPACHRGRIHDEDVSPAREPSARQDPKTSITVAEPRPQLPSSQNQQLLPRAQVLRQPTRRPRPTTDPDSPSPPREHCPLRSSSRKAEAGRHTSSSRT